MDNNTGKFNVMNKQITPSLAAVLGFMVLMDLWLLIADNIAAEPIACIGLITTGINTICLFLIQYIVNHTTVAGLYVDWSDINRPGRVFDNEEHEKTNVVDIFLRWVFCRHMNRYDIGFHEEYRKPYEDGDYIEVCGYVLYGHTSSRCCCCGRMFSRNSKKIESLEKGDIRV